MDDKDESLFTKLAIPILAIFFVYKILDRVARWPKIERLSERYIFVTGCDSGFGHDIARRLDSLGCHVIAGCLTEFGEKHLRKKCTDRLQTLLINVKDHQSVLKAYDEVKGLLPHGQGRRTVVMLW